MKLDSTDIQLLNLLQQDSKKTAKELGIALDTPVTTVYAKIKRMEELGLIQRYTAILDGSKLGFTATAFVLATFSYRSSASTEATLSQRKVAREVASFPEVQEVHIISGDWDLLIKVRTTDIDAVGGSWLTSSERSEGSKRPSPAWFSTQRRRLSRSMSEGMPSLDKEYARLFRVALPALNRSFQVDLKAYCTKPTRSLRIPVYGSPQDAVSSLMSRNPPAPPQLPCALVVTHT